MPEIRNDVSGGGGGELRDKLRQIHAKRGMYSDEQVNFIRESYLLDRMTVPWILERIEPKTSENAIYRIAIGRSYEKVPLSARLLAAHEQSKERGIRKGPEAGSGAADPVRADELLEDEPDWG